MLRERCDITITFYKDFTPTTNNYAYSTLHLESQDFLCNQKWRRDVFAIDRHLQSDKKKNFFNEHHVVGIPQIFFKLRSAPIRY